MTRPSTHDGVSKLMHSLSQSKTFLILLSGVLLCMFVALSTEIPSHSTTTTHDDIDPLFFFLPTTTTTTTNRRLTAFSPQSARTVQFVSKRGYRKVLFPQNLNKAITIDTPDFNGLGRIRHHLSDDERNAARQPWDTSIGPGPYFKDTRHVYTTDDDVKSNAYLEWDNGGKKLAQTHPCRPTKLSRLHYPTCNPMHELGFTSQVQLGEAELVGDGYFRQVFTIENDLDRFVLKGPAYGEEKRRTDDYTQDDFDTYFMDGLVSAAVTPHPLFVDCYAFCALGIMTEYLNQGDLTAVAKGQNDRCDPKAIRMGPDHRLVNENDFTATQKLRYSLDMAEALALLHNHPMGVIVHDDVKPDQFLIASGDRIKLNDFNRVEIPQFDEKHGEYCKYVNGGGGGGWRAPEEYKYDPLDESIDVFSLGTSMYLVLTGVFNFPDICKTRRVQKALKRGEQSYLDPRFRQQSYGEGKLLDVINRTWAYKAEDRPSIGQVVVMLREILRDHLKWEKAQKRGKKGTVAVSQDELVQETRM